MNKLQISLTLLLLSSFAILYASSHLQHNSVKTCFEGYTLTSDSVCVQEIDEPPTPACPTTELVHGRGCRIQVPIIKKCEDGYRLNSNGECLYIVYSEVNYYCPSGFSDDGSNCIQTLPGETIDFCIDGDRVGDQCVRIERVEPRTVVSCPDGATLEEGRCWKAVDTFDCTGDFGCQRKCNEPNCRNSHSLRNLHGEGDLVPVSAPRPSKITLVAQICQKKLEVQALITQTCPPNYMDDGKGCFLQEYFPLRSECVATGGPVSTCPSIINYAPKTARCSNGTPGINGQCEETVIVKGFDFCPTGFESNGVACEGFLEAPLECAPDLVLKNGHCIGRRVHQAVVVSVQEEPASETLNIPIVPSINKPLRNKIKGKG